MFKVFCDESDGSSFVMAGFAARGEAWAQFNAEWNAVLAEAPAIDAFHMADSAWNGSYKKLPKLIDIIRKHVETGLAVVIPKDAYEVTIKGQISRQMDYPYFLGFYWIYAVACFWQQEAGFFEKMDFIFDSRTDQRLAFVLAEQLIATGPRALRDRMGVPPIPGDDKVTPALQAADILAWSVRRKGEFPDASSPLDAAADELLATVRVRRFDYTGDELGALMKRINDRNRDQGMITLAQYERGLPHRDKLISLVNKEIIENAPEDATVIPLFSFPAKQMKRFRLVRSCPLSNSPHLHRRVGDDCLAVAEDDPEGASSP